MINPIPMYRKCETFRYRKYPARDTINLIYNLDSSGGRIDAAQSCNGETNCHCIFLMNDRFRMKSSVGVFIQQNCLYSTWAAVSGSGATMKPCSGYRLPLNSRNVGGQHKFHLCPSNGGYGGARGKRMTKGGQIRLIL